MTTQTDQQPDRRGDPNLLIVRGKAAIEESTSPLRHFVLGLITVSVLRGRLRVYSFNASGGPLSQYLVRKYGARAVVINVVGNDFDESHIAYNKGPGWWVYVPGPDGNLRLRLVEYRPRWMTSVVYNSALARYLFFNLQFGNTWHRLPLSG
jgi:hypothetical protein